MKDEQSAASVTAAISPQSSSKMMTLFLSLIWAEAILYLMSAVCYLSNGNLSALACLTNLPQPILSILLAIHLMSLKSWARKTYIILTAYTILYALTPPFDFINDNVLFCIIDNAALLIGLCCLVLCFNKNVETMYAPDRDSEKRVQNNRFQCIVYWVLVVVVMVASGLLQTANEEGENDANEALKEYDDLMNGEEEQSTQANDYPPVGIVWRVDDGESYIRVTNKDPSQGLDVYLAIGSKDNYYRTIQPGGQVDFKQGYWGEGAFGIVRVEGYDYAIAVHIKGTKYYTWFVPQIPEPIDEREQAPIGATLDKSDNLTVVNKDPNRGYDVRLEVGEKRVRQTLTPSGKVVFSDFKWHDGTVGVLTVQGFDSVLVVYSNGDNYQTKFEKKEKWK